MRKVTPKGKYVLHLYRQAFGMTVCWAIRRHWLHFRESLVTSSDFYRCRICGSSIVLRRKS